MTGEAYIVATIRRWNIAAYWETIRQLPGRWHLVTTPQELTLEAIAAIGPRYIFFPHWSHKVPKTILESHECVCFHETDLPYGRGGSPLQNLIARGHQETVISALRMTEEFDAGPIYAKRALSLLGLGEEIFVRSARIVAEMIADIIERRPEPVPQSGEPTVFARRKPEQSRIAIDSDPSGPKPGMSSLERLFDHLRMLDADGYPPAFLDYGPYRLEFTRPALRAGSIAADVKITLRPPEIST